MSAKNDQSAIQRRRLLMWGGGAGLAALAACYEWRRGRLIPKAHATGATMRDHRVKLGSVQSKLLIARGRDPALNVRAALSQLGGLGQFISKTDSVLIKPNAAWERTPFQGATTHPEVVAELVRACREAGASDIVVTDCPVDDAARSFERSGILAAARNAGARVILPSQAKFVDMQIPGKLGTWSILEPFATASKIINVPVAKHHGSARVTAGMKNWIGITNQGRKLLHVDLDGSIAALAAFMRPTLTVVDASRILMRNGPRGGNLDDVKTTDAIAISADPVAADCWATELLGARLADVKYLKLAADRGLGKLNYRDMLLEVTTG